LVFLSFFWPYTCSMLYYTITKEVAMSKIDALRTRRDEILEEIKSLEQMRRGSVVEQVYESVGKDGEKVRRGPYLLYSFKEKGKTVSRRIKDPNLKIRYEEQIDAFRSFQELTAQLLRIGEQIADWALSGEEALKKTPSRKRSNSKGTPK